jgi:SAM-dependent methyltransferase
VTDVPYGRTFIPQLAPTMLRLVAALSGVAAPAGEDFEYCELGSARGDTLVTLAAANPRARFLGVDINPEHVALAIALAEQSDLRNVRFLGRDLEDLNGDDLPPLDFIGAHGMLSWISPAKRTALLRVASAKLKSGGLLYVSYNALPGWSGVEPLRRLILDHGGAGGASLDRARNGFAFARRLAGAGAAYFAKHPNAKAMIALIEQAGLLYVAHEYLNAHWHPMYFADVAAEMGSHGLTYVGQLPLYLNVPALAMPAALRDLAMSLGDKVAFDALKDYAVNELHRSDVYVKGEARTSEATLRDFFEHTPFGTVVPRVKRSARLPVYTLEYTDPIHDAVIGAISTGAATAVELASKPRLSSFGVKRIVDCLVNLSLGGQVLPLRRDLPVEPTGSAYRVASVHNQIALRSCLFDDDSPLVLAAPATGTGLQLSLFDALSVYLVTEIPPKERHAFVTSFAKPVLVDDRPVRGEKLLRALVREIDEFDVKLGPKLVELGILRPAAKHLAHARL